MLHIYNTQTLTYSTLCIPNVCSKNLEGRDHTSNMNYTGGRLLNMPLACISFCVGERKDHTQIQVGIEQMDVLL